MSGSRAGVLPLGRPQSPTALDLRCESTPKSTRISLAQIHCKIHCWHFISKMALTTTMRATSGAREGLGAARRTGGAAFGSRRRVERGARANCGFRAASEPALSARALSGLGLRTVGGRGARQVVSAGGSAVGPMEALIFDCDGVILLSEHLHREAYNKAFTEFGIEIEKGEQLVWTEAIYDVLQNTVGGGKPKMRWYFNKYGWPHQKGGVAPPETQEAREALVDSLQDFKIEAYKDLIANTAETRPGVLRLMKEAREAGMLVSVASASAKPSVIFCLTNLLGEEQFGLLDCFLAGSDVKNLKPDPEIYLTASKMLGVDPSKCLVIEDSMVGLNAAKGAEMDCVITYHSGTKGEAFEGAKLIVDDLSEITLEDLVACKTRDHVVDDRIEKV